MAKKLDLHKIYNLPKQLEIAGNTTTIYIGNVINKDQAVGVTNFNNNEIRVRTHFESEELAYDVIQVTFRHELLHMFAHILNEHEFNANEKLIDSLAQLWWQCDKQRGF